MGLSFADAVSVVQIAVYVLCFLLALVLCSRHGWAKSSGWAFLISFTCLRIICSACQLIEDSNPSKEVVTAYLITSSIGISPLTMLAMGLLSRVNTHTTPSLSDKWFTFVPLSSLLGMILGIAGGVKQSQSSTPLVPTTLSKAAVINFALFFLVTNVFLVILLLRHANVQKGEKRLLLTVSLSMPFIFVRILYALIGDFGSDSNFNLMNGSTALLFGMGVIPEMIVVLMSLGTGFMLRVISKDEKDTEKAPVQPSQSRLDSDHFKKSEVYGGQVNVDNLYPPQPWLNSSREPLTPVTPITPRRRGALPANPRSGRDLYIERNGSVF